jgi:hypothetical protein
MVAKSKQVTVADRKDRFSGLNQFVTERHGWLVSIPGAIEIRMQCLVGSDLPQEIAGLGYKPEMTGSAERILHHAIVEKLTIGADGTLVPMTEGSTQRPAEVRRHAGLVEVEEWTFQIP